MWLLQVLVVALGIFDLHCGMRSSSLTRDQTRAHPLHWELGVFTNGPQGSQGLHIPVSLV